MKKILISLLLIFSLFGCSVTHLRVPSSIEETLTLNDLPESQYAEVKKLGENLLRFVLHASFKSDDEKLEILSQAENYFNKTAFQINQNILAIASGRNDDLYTIQKVPLWTVTDEVNWLNRSVEDLPALKVGVNFEYILNMVSHLNLSLFEGFKNTDNTVLQDIHSALKSIQDSDGNRSLAFMKEAEAQVTRFINEFKDNSRNLAESDLISFNQPFWEITVKEFIKDYFDGVDVEVFKNMISDTIALGHFPSDLEMTSIIFNNSGPGLGKTLQQIGREEGMDEDMAKLMSQLESDGKPVPGHIAKRIIENDPAAPRFKHIDSEPIGTGTIAQVHRAIAVIDGEETEVAVRFLKPGIQDRAREDIKILDSVFSRIITDPEIQGEDLPDLDKLLQTLETFLNSDTDIKKTLDSHEMALDVYNKSIKVKLNDDSYLLDFRPPKLYAPASEELRSKTEIIVTEFISEGTKFSKISDDKAKKVVAQQLLSLWVEEALFRSGYTHADLHEGNFQVLLVEDGKKISVRFFDFGMNIEVDQATRRGFLLIGGGAAYNNPKLIAKGLLIFGNNAQNLTEKQLAKVLRDEIAKNGVKDQAGWVTWGIRNGYKIPDNLGVLTRGGALVNQLPTSVGDKGIEVKFVEDFALKYRLRRFVNRKYDFPLTNIDLVQVGYSMMKSKCSTLLKKIFGK